MVNFKTDVNLKMIDLLESKDYKIQELEKCYINLKLKYTNPAYRHSRLLQAKVVGPSYGTNVLLTCE